MGSVDLGTSPPTVRNTHKGEAFVLSHREYLGDLLSANNGPPTLFEVTKTFALNPGNPDLFPWLAPIAAMFQEYEIRGMLVELKTLSSDFTAALNMGAVFMSADYNVLDAAPIDKKHLENMEYASSCKPSCSLIMPIECDPKNDSNTHLYIARNEVYEGGDKRLFDLCNIFIGSQGIPVANAPIAEIWVTYEVALFKPIIPDIVSEIIAGAHFQLISATVAKPLANPVGSPANASDITITTNDTIHFPGTVGSRWLVLVDWSSVNANFGVALGTTTLTGGVGTPPLFATGGGNNLSQIFDVPNTAAALTATQNMAYHAIITVTAPGCTLAFNHDWTFPAATFGDVHITQYPLDILT